MSAGIDFLDTVTLDVGSGSPPPPVVVPCAPCPPCPECPEPEAPEGAPATGQIPWLWIAAAGAVGWFAKSQMTNGGE